MRNQHFQILGIFTSFLLLSVSYSLLAQEVNNKPVQMFHNWSRLLSPEKVYLHTDKDVYFATDTIWFSGYVENASYASEFEESNYIYVELISNQLYRDENSLSNYAKYSQDVVVRKKIRRIGNNFQGHLVVPEMNSTGRAIIRAYTYWMLNRPTEYMFYKELEITNPMKDNLVSAMQKGDVKYKQDYLRIGELSPDEKLKIEAKEEKVQDRYDVQFLPESGNILSGKENVLFVKAIGKNGAGVSIYGEISDSNDNVVVQYSTDSLGFGRVVIPSTFYGQLRATVIDSSGYQGKPVRLQHPVLAGVTINGRFSIMGGVTEYTDRDVATFVINTTESVLPHQLKIFFHNGSEVYYSRNIVNPTETVVLALKPLPPGIHTVSIIDSKGNVFAERPFIVLPQGKELMSIQSDKQRYKKREHVDVKIHLPADLMDNTANFSVAVTDIGLSENSERTSMQSYMLLKSEVKGYIEAIDWYFNDTIPLSIRMHRADKLLQTQGWRYYDFGEIVQGRSEIPYFGREYTQTLFGKVVNPIGLTKKATVSFLAPSINFKAMGQIDSGYFVLRDISFPENTRFIVSAVGKNGRSQNHMPILQNDYFAPIFSYPIRTEPVIYSDTLKDVVKQIYYSNDDGDHQMSFELDPVVIKSLMITPKNSPSPIPNYPIQREWFRDTLDMKAYARNYTVSAYVTATYPGVHETQGGILPDVAMPIYLEDRTPEEWPGDAHPRGIPAGSLIGKYLSPASFKTQDKTAPILRPKRLGVVLVYLNGNFVYPEEAVHTVLSMPLSEVESIIYVSGLNASTFQPSFSSGDISSFPVLMVRTKPHIRTDAIPYNVSSDYPLGWQKPAKMYSPRYDNAESRKNKIVDNRITLYWNPSIQFDSEGVAYISFYTSDSDSNYRVEVEGRSAARQYHYAEKIIERVKESTPAKKK
ncbi:MAG: hypothetical protein J6Q34_06235 [Bacteroidales bacterium]|nr:hypothetical protein [Bacteroidales bacterium]